MKKQDNLKWCAKLWAVGLIAIAVIVLLISCSSSKQVEKVHEQVVAQSSFDSAAYKKQIQEQDSLRWAEQLKQLTAQLQFGNECNDSLLTEIIESLQSEYADTLTSMEGLKKALVDAAIRLSALKSANSSLLKLNADGSIEVKGLRSANLDLIEQVKELVRQQSKMLTDQADKKKEEKSVVVKTDSKLKDSKTKFLNFWWLLVIGYVVGWAFPPLRIFQLLTTRFHKN